jgi:pimeloyl-ACP methyl ester carboxylesterase
MPNPSRRGPVAAVLVIALLVLAGCSGGNARTADAGPSPSPVASDSSASSEPSGPAGPGAARLARFYDQKLDWTSCRGQFQCARMRVPLDYTKPGARSISIALIRLPAQDRKHRVGSLLINPGGPGVSGFEYVAAAAPTFGESLRRSFDLVGFDPRGVGRSTPLSCLDGPQLDRVLASDPDPDTPQETKQTDALITGFGKACERRDAGLTAHVSTDEAARDMDVLRAVVGDPKLSYFGFSYGTYLGATYAGLFPHRVGRMVLDGALDPSLTSKQGALVQAHGFEVALRAYVQHCVDGGDCFLGSTVDEGTHRIRQFLDQVDRKPLPGAPNRQLTEGYAMLGIWQPLYYRSEWGILDSSLKAGFAGNGAPLLSLADYYTERGPRAFKNNSTQLLYAINCLDHDDGIPSSQVASLDPEFEKASPTFGRAFAYTLSACQSWPVHTGRTGKPVHAPGAAPIMVVGTTRDPATPLAGARGLVRQLDDAVLVTRDGDGHTAYHQGSSCVDRTIEAYLVSGTVPKKEVDCS